MNERLIRVMVVDDHPVVRDGVTMSLATSQAMEVVSYAGSGPEACGVAETTRPDVILLDLRLGNTLASEVVADLIAVAPNARIALFTAYPAHAAVSAAIQAGAVGVIVKDAPRGELVRAVISLMRDGFLPGRNDHRSARPTDAGAVLTPREYDVLRRVAIGQSNPEIAAQMYISRNTVKGYLQNAMHKLGARNRVEAIAKGRDRGLL